MPEVRLEGGGGTKEWWTVGAAANVVILIAYLTIGTSIAMGLRRSGQTLHENPLGWATCAIFFTCAVHHGSHPVHQLLPVVGLEEHTGAAMRRAFNDWHVSTWDIVTAGVAVWYLSLRNRFPALVRGAAIFEDLKVRQRQALDIHDNIVQGLATAKISFEMNRIDEGMRAVEDTLAASRKIITDLLGDDLADIPLEPGKLRRDRAAMT